MHAMIIITAHGSDDIILLFGFQHRHSVNMITHENEPVDLA